MDTNRLKHFCAVAELESLSKAAELLGITHSGLHKSLKVLEDELSIQLTTPKGRGITLTKEAKNFYPKAIQIINLVEQSIQTANIKTTKTLKLAGLEVFIPFFSHKLSQDNELSKMNIDIHEFAPGELESAIFSNTVDYGLTYIPVPKSGIQFLKISRFQMGVFCSNKKFLTLDINHVPFVAPHAPLIRNPTDIKNRDGWTEHKVDRFIKYKTNSLFTALELTKAGLCAIYMPDFIESFLNKNLYRLRKQSRSINHYRDLYLVMRTDTMENQETKKITKLIRKWIK